MASIELNGTTWVLNNTLTGSPFSCVFTFKTSNDVVWDEGMVWTSGGVLQYWYRDDHYEEDHSDVYSNGTWASSYMKTITITSSTLVSSVSEDFITWLRANATQEGAVVLPVIITEQYLSDIADAIRSKNGSSDTYTPAQMAAAITDIPTSADIKMGVIRPDAELVRTISYDKYINADEGVTIPAYTTTAQTLLASASLTPTVTLDLANYNYYVLVRMLAIPEYNVTTKAKGRVEYWMGSTLYEIVEIPANSYAAIIEPTRKYASRNTTVYVAGNAVKLVYYSSASAITPYNSASYGTAMTVTAPAISGSTLTLKSPVFIIRGNTTYFTSTYFNALTDIREQYVIDVYRAPKNNLNLDGWGVATQAMHIIDCVNNNAGKLT